MENESFNRLMGRQILNCLCKVAFSTFFEFKPL
jgi:hypothetical protein